MRLLVILVCVAAATANPLKKSMNAKAMEPVDQHLDSLRSLESVQSVDRAKKDVTTFCVQVHQDKQVLVDCNDKQPIQPAPMVIPAQQPQPEQQPSPAYAPSAGQSAGGVQPVVIQNGGQPNVHSFTVIPHGQEGSLPYPKPQSHTLNIEVPCEPEMAAYVIQPPEQVVYAPTGNCYPQITQVPNVVQVPGAPASPTPAQILQTGHHALHGLHGAHGLHHSLKPVHTHTVVQPAAVQPTVIQPTYVQTTPAVQPAAVQPAHPHHHHGTGMSCTCHSTPDSIVTTAKAAGEPMMSDEALATKFIQDLQKNAVAKATQTTVTSAPSTSTIQMSVPAGGATVTMQGAAPPGSTMRYLALTPTSGIQTPMVYSQLPIGGQQIMYSPSGLRMKALQDSFGSGPVLTTLARPCREDGEKAAAPAGEAKATAQVDLAKSSPSEIMEQMKKNDDAKNPRIARFIAEKDDAENSLDDN